MKKPPKPSALEDHLGFWLRYVSNHVSQSFGAKMAGQGISIAEWALLRVLYDSNAVAPSEAAARLGLTRGAVSKLTDKLVAKSFITRKTGEKDRRYQVLSLSSAGRQLVLRLAALADENDAAFFGHLKPAQRAALKKIMQDMVSRFGLAEIPTE